MNFPTIDKVDNSKFYFSCGCTCGHTDFVPKIDFDNLNKECVNTYELLSEGFVNNCFQLESNLGRHWSKEVAPKNILDISLLISLIRPSTLNSKENDGHSVASHIVKRRKGEELITYPHPLLESILKETAGYQNYQEQIMSVAQIVAGFNPNQADSLRKGIGKKLPEVIAKLKEEFFQGCRNTGLVDEDTAKQLFVSIDAASRYSFNKCSSQFSLYTYTDGTSETLEEAFNKGSWKGKKTYSLQFTERKKPTCPNDNLLKNSTVVQNEIEDMKYAGEQTVYRITLKRKMITDKYFAKTNRPNFSITVTASHKHPTRCHGILRTDELKPFVHSLYVYDVCRKYQPQYKHAASRVIKVERIGVHKVYDVTMRAPHHNFLCDGVFTCNSHSVGYGTQTYYTAWAKTHFPLEFYTANLRLNEDRGGKKDKLEEEKAGMIKEANNFGIAIISPTIEFPCVTFTIKDNNTIVYGLSNIKSTGETEATKVIEILNTLTNKSWLNILFYIGSQIKSSSFENICLSGFFKSDVTRQRMVYEYKSYRKLSDKEVNWIQDRLPNFNTLEDALVGLIDSFAQKGKEKGIARVDRIPKIQDLVKTLRNPPHPLEDTPLTINRNEKELFGVPLTYSDVEARTMCGVQTNSTCKELADGKLGKNLSVAVSINRVKEHKTKKGQNMAFLSCSDAEAVIESAVVFCEAYSEYGNLLVEKNTVILYGEATKSSFIVSKVTQL